MNKLAKQLFAIVLSFFVLWFLLSRIDWVGIFKVKEATNKTEQKIGDLYVEMIQQNETVIEIDSLIQPIVDIIDQIKKANNIDSDIKLYVLDKDEINAFAIPNDNLVLFSGLINDCQSPEELAGVIGHEIAHMEKNHVMKKLVKEVGLSVLVSMASGGNGTIIKETFKTLTSSAYDRKLESEADLTSVKYLKKADIDFRPFAEFLFRLSLDDSKHQKHLQILSSHPGSEDRATSILEENKNYAEVTRPIMPNEKWISLQDSFQEHISY